ncbi:carbohydrate-binding module family 13 protein [Rhizophagus clarus]|uniref:Carbohydrate-binding module family 13 protein n=1 Tax=Rhizophagus clarus TaxID=94130 RepID=A0A8H3QD76_9GLOM|nr:carbohydrate-binding module family 13 protein [Rhizophagus clarus]
MDDNKFLSKLTQNLLEILNDEEYYDITIEVGNDPYKNDGTLVNIKLPNISPETFQIILRYIYGGRLSLNEYDTLDLINVLVAASELKPNKIFDSVDFSTIPEKLLVTIIQSDNRQISEIQIWENVLKWGLAQNPELPSDSTNYSKNDFKSLKNTLQGIIPFIKFYNLTSKEFLDKVLPYEKIFPKNLYKDLLRAFLSLSDPYSKPSDKSECSMAKESKKTIDSKIITYQHAELISKWIDKLEITDKLISSYEFKLLFRASRDGYSGDKFHEICNDQPRTITIVKVKGSSEILGGYNPIEWKSNNTRGTTEDSFIFSFNNDGIENYILSRVINKMKAIYNSSVYGPCFGDGDLIIWRYRFSQNTPICYSTKVAYEKSIRGTGDLFGVEECEVFQIV